MISYDSLERGSQQSLCSLPSISVLTAEESQYGENVLRHIARAKRSVHPLMWRAHEELDLVIEQINTILLASFFLIYLTMVVFLNLAYYHYKVGPRLHDIGHQIFPEVDELSNIVDSPMYMLYPFVGVLFLSTIIPHEGVTKPYLVNIILRFGCVFAIGHTLRAATYLATSVPGSANHCLDAEEVEKNRPTFAEIFYKPASVTVNCGDLMFSGHMLQMILFVLIINHYGRQCFQVSKCVHLFIVTIALLLCIAQSCVILMARHHYTSDIIVAAYVTPLLWYFYNNAIHKEDMKPNHERIAKRLLGTQSLNQQ